MKHLRRKLKVLSLLIAVSLFVGNLGVIEVHAETTEDLFELYGVDLGGVALPTIQTSLEQIEQELHEAEQQQQQVDWVNSSIEASQLQYEQKKEEVYNKVDGMIANNMSVVSTIEQNIYGDINTLLSNDSVYKSNTIKINTVLSELDGYSSISYMTAENIDIDSIMQEYNDTIAQYQVAVDVYELGEVTDIKYIMDREYYVNSEFGTRIDPLNPSTTRYHSGLDLRCEVGTEVGSLFNGVVSGCGWSDTSGYWVRIEHGDNVRSFYCHLSEIKCEVGQEVSQYEVIALSGATGSRCTGPHLHLGAYINGNAVDPQLLFE